MRRLDDLCPHKLLLEPELAALAILDTALMASRAALISEHPEAGHFGIHAEVRLPPLVVVAALLVDRTTELRGLLAHYRRALADFRSDPDDRQVEFPF
jgi:hypothetical protein